jgi:2-C-methyl-D-erythritol 2,4-cyclodiphosphate synthase
VPKKFSNRDQWGGIAEYRQRVSGPMTIIGETPELLPALVRYVEAKCLLSGVTASQGIALFSNAGVRRFYRGIVRNVEATDEAALAERAGYRVHVVDGDPGNVKITTEEDLDAARRRMAGGVVIDRAGTGYDLHRLVEGRPPVIGGVSIPFERGALGHSDADVACHAATDAILGAACLGDIGRHFPDSDPRWKDADSLALLRDAARLVREKGYEVGNLDITVILERPKIKDAIDEMRRRLADALGVDPSRVSVKGKTNEGVDAVGRGEAIAAHAVALLRSR